jgi:CCR4-NOT transcription complex subunit 4
VEEFDLSDKNFRPCPCGYQVSLFPEKASYLLLSSIALLTSPLKQVCQFCFNNIRTNMNGLCPACRRPYDEKTIEFKTVSPEE